MTASSPTSASYDFVVIGGGSAGLTAARFAARLGRKTAVIESGKLGGDCTWTGCVPSKALIRAARASWEIRRSDRFGISASQPALDFATLMARINSVIEDIYNAESPEKLLAEGIDTIAGRAEFIDTHELRVGESEISFSKLLIATGARPALPPIPGLDKTGYLTYETVWSLTRLPERLLVIGGGPIGCELAQAFNRLGSDVVLLEEADRILPNVDPEASEVLHSFLSGEGVSLRVSESISSIEQNNGQFRVVTEGEEFTGEHLLVATGRLPNLNGLELGRAGIGFSSRGIKVDKYLRTSRRHIFAAGDCTGGPQFTHYAGWQGFMAARNALLPGKTTAVQDLVPSATFTDPELAQTGHTESSARQRWGDSVQTAYWPMSQVDRATIDGVSEGFVKAIMRRNGQLVGATIVCPGASELINQWSLSISRGMKLGDFSGSLHAYPSYSMAGLQMSAEHRVASLLDGLSGKVISALSRGKQ